MSVIGVVWVQGWRKDRRKEGQEQLKPLMSPEKGSFSLSGPPVVGRQAVHLQSRSPQPTEQLGREELATQQHLTEGHTDERLDWFELL